MAGFSTYPPAVDLLSLQECLSWGHGDSAFFQLGKTLTQDPCKNQNLKLGMYFSPWGGFLNDLEPNMVADLPVIPLVWQERGHARASRAVRLSSLICRVARPHRALLSFSSQFIYICNIFLKNSCIGLLQHILFTFV